MPNLALYRKYRPTEFSDVVGQETITRILKNQIINDRVGHAYLLSGIRGTGKTTIAKIFAKAVNCENPINGEACGVCPTCKQLNQDNNMNIIEIDAASNRGVDEIRNLRETIKYPPSTGKYKVYIIDEVHMLTKEAFNALLKTLEEPPSHALFILATTEAHRLPATILSRCQKFNIKPISDSSILERLEEICKKENINIEESGLNEIAHRGDHSMRDALSLLDQCADLNLPGELITESEIQDFLGISPKDQLSKIAELLAEKNGSELLKELNQYRSQGVEDAILLEDLSHYFQNLLYYKITKTKDSNFEENFLELETKFSIDELYTIIDVLLQSYSRLRFNALSEIVTNTALLSLCSEELLKSSSSNKSKIIQKPKKEKILKPEENTVKTKINSNSNPEIEVNDENISKTNEIEINNSEKKEISTKEVQKIPKNNKSTLEENYKKLGIDDLKAIRTNIVDLAVKRNEKLIKELIDSSELKLNKNGLFILLDENFRFMFDSKEFYRKVQNLVNEVFGYKVNVYPKIKQDYYKFLNSQHQKKEPFKVEENPEVKEEFDVESHIKSIIANPNIKYSKVDN